MSTEPTDGPYADFVAVAWGPLYRTGYLMVGTGLPPRQRAVVVLRVEGIPS